MTLLCKCMEAACTNPHFSDMEDLRDIEVRACSAATMVIGRPGGAWWHPGGQTPCTHEGEPQAVQWISAGRCSGTYARMRCDRESMHGGRHAHHDGEELVKW